MFDELDTRTQRTMEKEGLLEPVTLQIGGDREEFAAEASAGGGSRGKQPISPATDRSASTRATDDAFAVPPSAAAPSASHSRPTPSAR